MDGIHRQLLAEASAKGDVVGPFFGFMGAAAALVFACEFLCNLIEIVQSLVDSGGQYTVVADVRIRRCWTRHMTARFDR